MICYIPLKWQTQSNCSTWLVYWTLYFPIQINSALSNNNIVSFFLSVTHINRPIYCLIWRFIEYLCLSMNKPSLNSWQLLPNCITHLQSRVTFSEQCLYISEAPQALCRRPKKPLPAFAWVTSHISTIQWGVLSSRDSHQKPIHKAAPHYSRAAGQAGGFQPAYHRDNAVLCKAQGNKTTPVSLVRIVARHCLSTLRILASLLQQDTKESAVKTKLKRCGPAPSSEKQKFTDVSAAVQFRAWLIYRLAGIIGQNVPFMVLDGWMDGWIDG